jgi:hypothetical protein
MDINMVFDLEVTQHCLRAEVAYDLPPRDGTRGGEVSDCIRVDQAYLLCDDKSAHNRGSLKAEQVVQLQEKSF